MERAKIKYEVICAIKDCSIITKELVDNKDLVITEKLKFKDLVECDELKFLENISDRLDIKFSIDEANELLTKELLKDIIDYIYDFLKPFPECVETIIN